MSKCSNCGHSSAPAPRCPRCQHWGTLVRHQRLNDVPRPADGGRISSGIGDFDEILGGGFMRGVVYRLSGDPGAGKSTLALDVAIRIANAHPTEDPNQPVCLYVCGEEAPENVRQRAEDRLKAQIPDGLVVGGESCVEDLAQAFPASLVFVVVDSLNAWASPGVNGAGGSNGQMVHSARGLASVAKASGATMLALSHVNAEGEAAGARAIDHWVDATLVMHIGEEERGSLRVIKNRHGRAPLRVFYEHEETGLSFHGE